MNNLIDQFKHFSLLLRYRLYKPKSISSNILDTVDVSRTVQSNHLGKYTGYFWNSSEPCFLLYVRWNPFGSCGFVYYITVNNPNVKECPPIARSEVRRFLETNSGIVPEFSVLNINHDYDVDMNLAVIVEVVSRIIGPSLKKHFKPLRQVKIKRTDTISRLCPSVVPCDMDNRLDHIVKALNGQNLRTLIYKSNMSLRLNKDWTFLIIKFGLHYAYLVNSLDAKKPTLCLPHRYMLSPDESIQIQMIYNSLIGSKTNKEILTVRLIGDEFDNCTGDHCIQAILLLMGTRPLNLLSIKIQDLLGFHSDVRIKIATYGMEQQASQTVSERLSSLCPLEISSQGSNKGSSRESSQTTVRYMSSQSSTSTIINVDDSPELVFSCPDNVGNDDILTQTQEDVLTAINEDRACIKDSWKDIPIFKTLAFDDRKGTLLEDTFVLKVGLMPIIEKWRLFTSVTCSPMGTIRDLAEKRINLKLKDSRYEICPINESKLSMIIIIDVQKKEWYWLDGTYDSNDVEIHYNRLINSIRVGYPSLAERTHYQIEATNHFHVKYPRVHLLMMMHMISWLFRYAVTMPKKISYTESAFRRLCWSICTETQIANHEHNINNGLVDTQGELLPGAYYSYSSSVQYERAVSDTKSCMVCRARGLKNMAKHLELAHGGKSSIMNMIRHS